MHNFVHHKDIFFHYKIPALQIKYEGGICSGMRTILVNLNEVANAIDRPAGVLIKHFAYDLGVGALRHYLLGRHESDALSRSLTTFVKQYVICSTCANSTTQLLKCDSNQLKIVCKMCGELAKIPILGNKIASVIFKSLPDERAEVL